MKKKYIVVATSTKLFKDKTLLPMKQGPKQEAKKLDKQKNEELCNFIKNAFCVDGNVSFVYSKESLKIKSWFMLEDSERGKFIVAIA